MTIDHVNITLTVVLAAAIVASLGATMTRRTRHDTRLGATVLFAGALAHVFTAFGEGAIGGIRCSDSGRFSSSASRATTYSLTRRHPGLRARRPRRLGTKSNGAALLSPWSWRSCSRPPCPTALTRCANLRGQSIKDDTVKTSAMLDVVIGSLKSETQWLTLGIMVLGVLQDQADFLTNLLGQDISGKLIALIGVLVAVFRAITKTSLSEKARASKPLCELWSAEEALALDTYRVTHPL